MKLSPAAEFAVRGALVLAERDGKGPVTLETICSQRELPRQYLVKIFSLLTKAGIIMPVRGKRGGYLLARAADSITLLEIIEAIEGPVALNFCQRTPSQCDRLDCVLRPIWSELQEDIRSRLGSVTLASCVGDGKPVRQA
ncbi:MAG: Rrf2 family transcriptional regulator [Phycisphaerae bacterium]|jgi:Rrf2 family protein